MYLHHHTNETVNKCVPYFYIAKVQEVSDASQTQILENILANICSLLRLISNKAIYDA